MKATIRTLPALLGALLLAGAVLAADTGAMLSGSVVSSSHAGLSSALVTIAHRETGRTRTTGTGIRGLYRVGGLDQGTYSVTVELAGFAASTVIMALGVGEARTLNFVLSPSGFVEKVTVTTASPRDSLEAADMRRSAARDIGEALSALPGLWTLRKGGIANDVVIRGFQSRDLNILIDGDRIYGACPNRMDPPAFHVDFAEVDRIEVAKGPFDVKNAGGLGGSVNIVTRPPEPGWRAVPFLAAGSWGYVNPSAAVSYGRTGFSAIGGISYRTSKPYEDGSGARFTQAAGYEPGAVADDAFRVGTGWAKMIFEPSKGHTVQVSYTRQEADHVDYPYLLMDAIYDDTDRARIAYELTREEGVLKGFRTEAYLANVRHWMTDEFRLSSAGKPRDYSMGTLAGVQTAGGRIEARTDRLTAGLEAYRRQWDATTEMAASGYAPQRSLPDASTDLVGLYVETEQPLSIHWKLSAGARVDRARSEAAEGSASTDLYFAYNGTRSTSRTDTLPSGYLRFIRRDDSWELSAGAGRSTRVPEPNERYFALRRMGSDWVGSPGLGPSRNTGADLSLTWWRPGLRLSGSLFGSRVDDNITICDRARVNPVPGVANTAARTYANADATLWGAEASAVVTVTGRLFLSADASYVRGTQQLAREDGILSDNLPEIPPARFRATLRYDTGQWWTDLEGTFSGSQRQVDTDLLEQPTPGWAIANLRGGVERGPLSVTIGVTNLFNRTYHEHLSYQRDPFRSGTIVNEPGRSVFLNAGYRFRSLARAAAVW